MNDQRQVIFSQRLRILKEENISEILNDFFEEILKNLENVIINYQKSNDEKYLTEIKSLTGNSISDEKLKQLASEEKEKFISNIKNLFVYKQKDRVKILGKKQNEDLEKKIFLQIIDFSWRSHLQYLEQLRQVIGLRQYGQKDPLSEFKKEAFMLFENLLLKIKNDIIKLLFNLDIVVSDNSSDLEKPTLNKNEKSEVKKVGRNEKCPCGSGKKYKHCHGNI